jgi:hypothetical protein
VTASYSAKFTYKNSSGRVEVQPGFLPPGFLAIDLAHALGMPLYDPSSLIDDAAGGKKYMPVDPTIPQQTATVRQRPDAGNGLIGASGKILDRTDAKVIVAANGGSDLIYVPDNDAQRVRAIVSFLISQDYVGSIFVDDRFGKIPGALPLSSIRLKGATQMPVPAVAVGFKTFPMDAANPLMSAVQIADTTLQQGQGMHGSSGRDNIFNNMAAIGPDFKTSYVDHAPVGNADIVPTIAHLLGFEFVGKGKLQGRVLSEVLKGGPDQVIFTRNVAKSPMAGGKSTVLFYQQVKQQRYFDEACLVAVRGNAAPASCR